MSHANAVTCQIGISLAIEALLRVGFNVAVPVVDVGYDLLALGGDGACWRVQVKASRSNSATRARSRIRITRGRHRDKRYSPQHVDAFLVVNLRTRAVSCVPVAACVGKQYLQWADAARHGGVACLRRIKSQRC